MRDIDKLSEEIMRLKQEKNAIILAHNYQLPEVQDIGDFVGDSLALCRKAATTNAEVIVFCGVWFMAESAAILNPGKKVLLPDLHAGCPMADMVKPDGLRALQADHPDAVTVCYVNTNAEIKVLSDIACTSSNAEAVVRSIPLSKEIIFVPDKFLGGWISHKVGRSMILWQGYCPTHQRILKEHIEEKKKANPDAEVLAHPECSAEVVSIADFVGSTGQIIEYCGKTDKKSFIIATESGILHSLAKRYPDKTFIQASQHAMCANMKKITLEKVYRSLVTMEPVVTVDPDVASKALLPIERMLAIGA
jgi:quinolinate synthase